MPEKKREPSPRCPPQSLSPAPALRQSMPLNHGLPLLVPRQQDLPPRHPPVLQAPSAHAAAFGAGPGRPRSTTPPLERPSAPSTPHRAMGREAKTCQDALDVKPADLRPAADLKPADVRPLPVADAQPADVRPLPAQSGASQPGRAASPGEDLPPRNAGGACGNNSQGAGSAAIHLSDDHQHAGAWRR
ncbi:unnamed protein product [Effrenium voratum]|nr:unnamed protein product [Effrenium voratum]